MPEQQFVSAARSSKCWIPLLQVRDEYRTDWDAGRGGYGNIVKQELSSRQIAIKEQMSMYAEGQIEGGEGADDEAAMET